MKTTKLLAAAMVCCALVTGTAMAQESRPDKPAAGGQPGEMDMQAAMQAWEEAGKPGEMHQWIARSAGTWEATVRVLMPGMPPEESKGTMVTEMVLGGKYAHSMFKGEFKMGGEAMPFEGAGTLGYNNATKKFESTWMDSMSTATMFSTGALDAAKKVLTMTSEFMDPASKQMVKSREVTTWKNDNEYTMEFFHEMGGQEMKVMEIIYKRTKGADAGHGHGHNHKHE